MAMSLSVGSMMNHPECWPMISIDVRLKSFVKLHKSIRRSRISKVCRSSMIPRINDKSSSVFAFLHGQEIETILCQTPQSITATRDAYQQCGQGNNGDEPKLRMDDESSCVGLYLRRHENKMSPCQTPQVR